MPNGVKRWRDRPQDSERREGSVFPKSMRIIVVRRADLFMPSSNNRA
jgi:hypothetical protein